MPARDRPTHGRTVCVVGAESTGKTELCRWLARHFDVPWLPEYAREYFTVRLQRQEDGAEAGTERARAGASHRQHGYRMSDVAAIAREQRRRERALLRRIETGVVLDTDLVVVFVWWREKFGAVPAWLESALRAASPRLYLLCRPDLPWQPDPLRESPHDRQRLHGIYKRLLAERSLPFVEIGGFGASRFQAAAAAAHPCLTATAMSPRSPSSPPAA